MKVAIIFRGENVREKHADNSRKYCDALMCWSNWKKSMIEDLEKNGHECDVIFISYQSNKIEKIKEIINPKIIELRERINQRINFTDVISFIDRYKNEYDRFVISRCDFEYRIPITQWPKWEEKGIFIVNKDVHWPREKLYADVLFLVDSNHVDTFARAFHNSYQGETIHALGRYLYENNIDFHLMYSDYYHILNHPLHSIASLEETPDLNHPKPGIPVLDVSQWN